MKNWKKFTALFAAALALCLFVSCSNSAGGGGGNPAPSAPTPPAHYTVTFNANNGTSATETQTFTAGTAQALTSISDLGFSKSGFYFAGWGTTADATESAYADGAEYTASADITFYALWSAMPVYSVNISSEHGTVTPSPATGIAGTEITLSNTPATGWQFDSYTVTAGSTNIAVVNNKFTMPGQDVTVTANFTAIDYDVEIGSITNGSVVAKIGTSNVNTANYGQTITLTTTAESDNYRLNTLSVTANDGTSVTLSGTGNTRTFVMPAKSVTVNATFESKHTITLPTSIEGGTLTSSVTSAFEGDTVTLTITPQTRHYIVQSLTVTNTTVNGTGNTRTFVMPAQDVNVNVAFNFSFVGTTYKEVDTQILNGVTYNIVEFGDWPQNGLPTDSSVTVDETNSIVRGMFTYCKGSDGEWYTKCEYVYRCTNGEIPPLWEKCEREITNNDFVWFKVEPIRWRVLTTNYNESGKRLLLSEVILTYEKYYDGMQEKNTRSGGWKNSDYKLSRVRAFLNGISYPYKSSWYNSDPEVEVNDFVGKGFLQTAFSSEATEIIADTTVKNKSINIDNKRVFPCGNTVDKVFIPSDDEVSNEDYQILASPSKMTDFAKANGAYNSFWLRTPEVSYTPQRDVLSKVFWYEGGYVVSSSGSVCYCPASVVPALCLEN